jgi:hypothetical protein
MQVSLEEWRSAVLKIVLPRSRVNANSNTFLTIDAGRAIIFRPAHP